MAREKSEHLWGHASDPMAVMLPELGALYRFWRDAKLDRALPTRQEFTPEALRPWLGQVSIYERTEDGDDFRIRLEGTKVVALTGEDWTGRKVSAFDERFRSDLRACCLETCRLKLPLLDSAMPLYQKSFRFAQRLILPVSRDGLEASQVLVALIGLKPGAGGPEPVNQRLMLPG